MYQKLKSKRVNINYNLPLFFSNLEIQQFLLKRIYTAKELQANVTHINGFFFFGQLHIP